MEIFNVKDKLPEKECGSYLVYAPQSFPKNSRWVVAEYYDDVKGFYSESGEHFMPDVTHWCELPKEPYENALKWWNKLDERQKHTKIIQTFGECEPWEDSVAITYRDIETMYRRHYD